jgi:hypothetical protein
MLIYVRIMLILGLIYSSIAIILSLYGMTQGSFFGPLFGIALSAGFIWLLYTSYGEVAQCVKVLSE